MKDTELPLNFSIAYREMIDPRQKVIKDEDHAASVVDTVTGISRYAPSSP